MRFAPRLALCALALSLVACDGDSETDAGSSPLDAGDVGGADAGPDGRDAGPGDVDAGDVDAGAVDAGDVDAGPPPACDFRSVDGVVVIEAESLPINEDWAIGSDGDIDYIEWTGSSHNNDPTHGVMSIEVELAAAGRYRLQWHTRVGRGTNATEHNDVFFRYQSAAGFYGVQGMPSAEDRVYPRPTCDDTAFMATVLAMPNVTEASCPAGTSRDGWFKVYSSGALDWRWSARTSDSDAHDVIVEVDAPGVYTIEFAARADFSQLDRIVLHLEDLEDSVVRDDALAETVCP